MSETDAVTPARSIASGYEFTGPAVELGSVVVAGTPDAAARVRIPLSMFNRHGLVAGATGTGKTRTLQLLAEQLSASGVPVLMADMKGDLAGLSRPGAPSDRITERATATGDDWSPVATPTEFLSLGDGGIGVPVRATVDAFGPLMMAKVLGLNTTQESTLGLIFHWADDQGLPLHDLADLRAVITHLTSPEGKADLKGIGGVSSTTAGVILRAVTNLSAQGGDDFFGEPEIDVADLLRVDGAGRGVVSLVELADQAARPALFSTFLMWLLAELFETLPEVGDLDKPKIVVVLDEAHLLFADASKAFLAQIEQTVKLIRSKGVGVFFCTQLPTDVPSAVLSQLGARIQHALRAFTPEDQKALSRTVKTYPRSEVYALDEVLTSMGTGEAVVTVLSERGAPTPVAWTMLRAPRGSMSALDPAEVTAAAQASPLWARYGTPLDRHSAFEELALRAEAAADAARRQAELAEAEKAVEEARRDAEKAAEAARKQAERAARRSGSGTTATQDDSFVGQVLGDPTVRSFLRSAASAAGRELGRGLFGNRRRRR